MIVIMVVVVDCRVVFIDYCMHVLQNVSMMMTYTDIHMMIMTTECLRAQVGSHHLQLEMAGDNFTYETFMNFVNLKEEYCKTPFYKF